VGIGKFFKSLLESGKVDIVARYEILREAVSGTMSDFHMARDRETGKIVGLKVLDQAKTEALEARFKGLKKPTEGDAPAEPLAEWEQELLQGGEQGSAETAKVADEAIAATDAVESAPAVEDVEVAATESADDAAGAAAAEPVADEK
jgi:hypothetical protein